MTAKQTLADTEVEVLSGEVREVKTDAADRRAHESDIARTKAALAAQPKVTVKVQEDTYVGINGYGFLIKGKTKVEVPEQVAEILEEAGRI
jgi:hypothetical protein